MIEAQPIYNRDTSKNDTNMIQTWNVLLNLIQDSRFSHHQRREISKAMEAIEDDICIRFINVTDDHKKIEKLRASLVTGSNDKIISFYTISRVTTW